MIPWRSLLARSVAVGAIVSIFVGGAVFVGVKFAVADPGGPPTRNAFTYAGVLRNLDGGPTTSTTSLTFIFHRMGLPDCRRSDVTVTPGATGAFSVSVPIDGCPSTFFNGADVSYNVFVSGEDAAVVSDAAVTPVPYARFADQANRALVAARLDPPSCGLFRPEHPPTGSAPYCQSIRQLARAAGWTTCLPRPSVSDAGFASRQYFISSDCRSDMERREGWAYFEARFASLNPLENIERSPVERCSLAGMVPTTLRRSSGAAGELL